MPSLADYKLPVKGVFQDGPPSGDLDFYRTLLLQAQGIYAMVYERIIACGFGAGIHGFPSAPVAPLSNLATLLVDLRGWVLTAAARYLDTDEYPGGSIEGREYLGSQGAKCWDSDIFASAGIGDGTNWTQHPAGNPWGYPVSYSSVLNGIPNYPQHFNEIILGCQKLTHVFKRQYMVPPGPDLSTVEQRNGGDFVAADCDASKAASIASWDAASWTSINNALRAESFAFSIGGTYFETNLQNVRGKMTQDFTSSFLDSFGFPLWLPQNGVLEMYGFFNDPGASTGFVDGFEGNNTWQAFDTPTIGTIYHSQLLASTKAPFPAGCPVGAGASSGWRITISPAIVHAPVFDLVS